jgi:hypothetical protein
MACGARRDDRGDVVRCGEYVRGISTRSRGDWGSLVAQGVPFDTAAVAGPLSDAVASVRVVLGEDLCCQVAIREPIGGELEQSVELGVTDNDVRRHCP